MAATAGGGATEWRRTSALFNADNTNSPTNRSTSSAAVINNTESIGQMHASFLLRPIEKRTYNRVMALEHPTISSTESSPAFAQPEALQALFTDPTF